MANLRAAPSLLNRRRANIWQRVDTDDDAERLIPAAWHQAMPELQN
jgi:hypothetical protein